MISQCNLWSKDSIAHINRKCYVNLKIIIALNPNYKEKLVIYTYDHKKHMIEVRLNTKTFEICTELSAKLNSSMSFSLYLSFHESNFPISGQIFQEIPRPKKNNKHNLETLHFSNFQSKQPLNTSSTFFRSYFCRD